MNSSSQPRVVLDHSFIIELDLPNDPAFPYGQDSQQSDNNPIVTAEKEVRKNFDLKYKLIVANYAELHNNNSRAAKQFNVARTNVRKWRTQLVDIRDVLSESRKNVSRKRLHGGGLSIKDQGLEEELLYRFHEEGLLHRVVTKTDILNWTQELNGPFVAEQLTTGFVDKFLERNQLVLRKPNKSIAIDDEVIFSRAAKFLKHFWKLLEVFPTTRSNIINLDETSIYIDCSQSTIAVRGSQSVTVLKSGHEKLRVTALMADKADGTKIKPTLFLNRKGSAQIIENADCYIVYCEKVGPIAKCSSCGWILFLPQLN
ncbi:hypothetical protein GEMRC1_005027 [Eukaryota sp. GEM-RC1]